MTKVVVNRTFWLQQGATYCHYGRDLLMTLRYFCIIEREALVSEILLGHASGGRVPADL